MATLDDDVDQRVGDGADLRFAHQRQQLRHVVVVHRVHRRQVRARHPSLQAEALGLVHQGLDVPR